MMEKTMTKITCPDGRPELEERRLFLRLFVWEWVCFECGFGLLLSAVELFSFIKNLNSLWFTVNFDR